MGAIDITHIFQMCVDRNASDIHFVVDRPPILRVDGRLEDVGHEPLNPENTEEIMKAITSPEQQRRVSEIGGTDFGFSYGDVARFRVSVYREKGRYGLSLRLIPSRLLTLEEIGLPSAANELLSRPRGLVLVTGPTGSGKTTTLASMIDYINVNFGCHVITIEDPIEYYHHHKKSIITQREIGVDIPTFSEGVIRALRMDPDVILVGEMRDLNTIEAAITASETGHLVLATLHTTSAAETVDRIIDVFPPNQQEQIRTLLSVTLLAVCCQQLIPRASGTGRVGAFELMVMTPSIRNIIRERKTFKINSDIETGAKFGMKSLDQHLFELFQRGEINLSDMMEHCANPEMLQNKVMSYASKRR